MDAAIRISLEDIVYAAIELPEGEHGSLYVHQFIGQIGHISEDGVWFEVFVSLKANFDDHLAANLPEEHKPLVLEQEDQFSSDGQVIGKVPQIQVVRLKRKHILNFVPSKRDSFDLVHSLRTPCLRGKLVRMWATDTKTGQSASAIGRVISDCFRVTMHDRACKIVPEGNVDMILAGPIGKYIDRAFVPTRSPSAFNKVTSSDGSQEQNSSSSNGSRGDSTESSSKSIDRTHKSPSIVLQYPSQSVDLDIPLGAFTPYRLEVSNLSDEGRRDVDAFRRNYLDYLQGFVRQYFGDLRRETISATNVQVLSGHFDPRMNGPELVHAFTKENSFLGGMDQIDLPCLELGPLFLKWNKPFFMSGGEVRAIPNKGDVIYGYPKVVSGKQTARYKRENLCWLNASRVPGLDGFIQFLREAEASGGQNNFKPATVLGPKGEATIFSNLLFAYFHPATAKSVQFRWIIENVFWYYKF
jgi:hypothetical protein